MNAKKSLTKVIALIGLTLCIFSANAQNDKLTIKNKDINGDPNPYLKIGGGASFPCGERIGISLEDTSRYIFSAASAFCATLLVPNDTLIDFPNDGVGTNGKRSIDKPMSYQQAYERIKQLKPGHQNSAMGEKWELAAEQMQELYPNQVYEVNYNNQARTTFNYNNVFFEMLMSTQILAHKNEEQAAIIEQQSTTIEQLTARLEQIENYLNIDNAIDPHPNANKIWGEVSINPNPNTNGILQIAYQINEATKNVQLCISNIEGKQVYKSPLNNAQSKGNQNINIDLPAGTYLYYLESRAGKTEAQKLMIL